MYTATAQPFVRNRFTWLAYFMLAFYTYVQALVGLSMPFVRAELNLSYSTGALHISAFAVGVILCGAVGERLALIWGRGHVFWIGAAGMALGALCLTQGFHVTMTLASTFLMGLGGSLLLMTLQAGLSDQHGEHRTIALSEANVGASIGATFAPILIGGCQVIGLGWRGALIIAGAAFACLCLRFHAQPIPVGSQAACASGAISGRLPRLYWAYWTVLFIGIAVEWCFAAWSADFFVQGERLGKAEAAAVVSVFFFAMLIGRGMSSYLARTLLSPVLLLAAIGIALGGFPLFWLAPIVSLNVLGLFIVGLGVAAFFPLSLALALSVTPHQADLANARIVLGLGSAVLTVPLLIGWAADQLSIQSAYGIVGVILLVALCITGLANQQLASKTGFTIPAVS